MGPVDDHSPGLCWFLNSEPAFIFYIILLIYLLLAVLDLCSAGVFLKLWCAGSGFSGGGALALGQAPRLQSTGSVAVAHGLSCSVPCGIFLDQGSNPRLLLWQADSLPLSHQGSPEFSFLTLAFSERWFCWWSQLPHRSSCCNTFGRSVLKITVVS